MKHIITKSLLALALAFFALPMQSQDDMRIYFKDGTNRQLYLREVNSISTSQLDENGTFHSDAFYQHIETTLGELIFDLSEIDSIAFTKYDEAIVKENVQKAMTSIMPSLNNCESIADAEKIMDQLKESEKITDVRSDGEQLYVDIEKYGTISFDFGDHHHSNNTRTAYEDIEKQISQLSQAKKLLKPDDNPLKIVIANQAQYDLDKDYVDDNIDKLRGLFYDCNIVIDKKLPSIDFYKSDMFDYDVVFLITHGGYDPETGKHNLRTSDEWAMIEKNSNSDEQPDYSASMKKGLDDIIEKYHSSNQQIYANFRTEQRNGDYYWILNAVISESFFDRNGVADKAFPNDRSMLFNAACHSLQGNDNLAMYLRQRNLGTYIGYDESNSIGDLGGYYYLLHLLYGQSTAGAFNNIPEKYCSEIVGGGRTVNIHMIPSSDDYYNSTFITPTYTNEIDEDTATKEYQENKYVVAEGITTFWGDNPDGLSCGFEYGSSKYVLNRVVDGTFSSIPYQSDKGNRLFEAKFVDLEPNTIYYYRAYTYDGLYYNYGDTHEFTIKSNSNIGCPDDHHPHAIDLGLPSGTVWACCNVGSKSPEECGSYYAWGDTEEAVERNIQNVFDDYVHCDGDAYSCHDLGTSICGTEYDVAHVKWGGSWCMPTYDDYIELRERCSLIWVSMNGVDGLQIIGPNNNSLFFPAGGQDFVAVGQYGRYWTGTLYEELTYGAYQFEFFRPSGAAMYDWDLRGCGHNIRPVCK